VDFRCASDDFGVNSGGVRLTLFADCGGQRFAASKRLV